METKTTGNAKWFTAKDLHFPKNLKYSIMFYMRYVLNLQGFKYLSNRHKQRQFLNIETYT